MRRRTRKRGGAVMEPHSPLTGLKSILSRGGNASRGLSASEKRTLKGGYTKNNIKKYNTHTLFGGGVGYGMTAADADMQAHTGSPSGIGIGNHNSAGVSVSGYKNCGIIPSFKLGAGTNWKSVGKMQIGASKKKRGSKQKGGYAQFGSNQALTYTQQLPNGSEGGSWEGQLSTPPTYSRANLCRDNYNHFTGKTMRSPVLDQDVKA